MLDNLIESGSQAATLKRRTSVFLITLLSYGALIILAGAASIYVTDAHLAAENLEEIEFITFPHATRAEPRETPPRTTRSPSNALNTSQPRSIERTDAIAPTDEPGKVPTTISVVSNAVPSIPTGMDYKLGVANIGVETPLPSSTVGDADANESSTARGTAAMRRVAPPPLVKKELPAPESLRATPRRVSKGVINGEALKLPSPVYPTPARLARQSGTVPVQVVIDERGKVISAQATGGPALLRASAVRAALQARFAPTLLSNEPVIVQGIISYQFKLD